MVTHLHVHSNYSLLSAVSSPSDIAKKAKLLGMEAVALTDYGTMFGSMEFYYACKNEGVKPIIGVCAYMTDFESVERKEYGDLRHQIVLLAKNNTGYYNLVKLMSKASLDGFYYVPRIDRKMLKDHSEGLIALSGTLSGEIPRFIQLGRKDDEILAKIKWYQEIFGDDFYLEISHHPEVEGFKSVTNKLIEIGKNHNIPMVACQQVFYLEKEHNEAHDLLLCIRDDKEVDDASRFSLKSGDYSFLSTKEMEDLFSDTPDALINTQKIASQCEVDLSMKGWVFPKIKLREDTKDEVDMLNKISFEGIEDRMKRKPTQEEIDRLNYELEIIHDKGFTTYMLLCKQITDYLHSENIATTTRGSAAGSLVSFALGVTRANPLFFDLPFERFLNPMRPKAPDIDLDIEARRRDDVINWTRQTFGEENVAQIITFGTLSAKNVIKDVARAFKRPFSETNEITKLIPVKWGKTDLKSALKDVPELNKMYTQDPVYKKIFDISIVLEGCPRHTSVHAAGVLITPSPITNYVPLARDARSNMPVTQYNMVMLEEQGLMKMDYLGLRNLGIITDCIDAIRARRNIKVDIENIPLDDKKTFELLGSGNTFGLFQLESSGMTRYLKELKPTSIFDIQAMIALYRPGPLENIPEYVARKNGKKPVTYLHPDLKPILERTYGVLVYQDDVLLMAIKMAGYTWLDADKFRKGMGKKVAEVIQAERDKFINGCTSNGYTASLAEKLFDLVGPFAGYGFNKAHAAAYSLICYQTAYLKANFTIEYMAALLQAEAEDIEKTTLNIMECENMGVNILPPNINESFTNFTALDDKTIRFGLCAIKGLGSDSVKVIIKERKTNGNFKDIIDFLRRVPGNVINKKSMESLIYSGALDEFGSRNKFIQNLDTLLSFSKACQTEAIQGQSSLFDSSDSLETPSLELKEAKEESFLDKLFYEKNTLGLYISGHPLDGLKNYLRKKGTLFEKLTRKMAGQNITMTGMIRELRRINTKNGDMMASFKMEDPTGEISCLIFSKAYEAYADKLEDAKICVATGTLQYRQAEEGYTLIVRELSSITLEDAHRSAKENGLYSDTWKVKEIRKQMLQEKEDIELEVESESNFKPDSNLGSEIVVEDTENLVEIPSKDQVSNEFFELSKQNMEYILVLPVDVSKDKILKVKEILDDQKDGDYSFTIKINTTSMPYKRKISLDEYFEDDLYSIFS